MVQNFINFITGKNTNMDDNAVRDINRIQLELEKTMLERELSHISDRMIHRI